MLSSVKSQSRWACQSPEQQNIPLRRIPVLETLIIACGLSQILIGTMIPPAIVCCHPLRWYHCSCHKLYFVYDILGVVYETFFTGFTRTRENRGVQRVISTLRWARSFKKMEEDIYICICM